MQTLNLYPQPLERVGNMVRRSCKIERQKDGQVTSSRLLWYEFPDMESLPADIDSESYLLATILQGMSEKRNIVVRGRVSKELLENLIEFRDAWCCWLPRDYHPIDLEVDEIADDTTGLPGAVCAFSGGIDSTFSVWNHTKNRNSYRSQAIRTCAMIHGFDIPLSREEAFINAFNQATITLKSVGISLIPIRTNFRTVIRTNWTHIFAAALVSVLQNLKKKAGTCILGSSEPYHALVLPWGSNPITDCLLTSGDFRVLHDGAKYSRTQKAAAINEWEEGRDNLRVCWQGYDRNCGECEKCLRTMANFRANNLEIPPCFPHRSIRGLSIIQERFSEPTIQAEWSNLIEIAISNNVQDEWIDSLSSTLQSVKNIRNLQILLKSVFPKGSIEREFIKKIINVYQKMLVTKQKLERRVTKLTKKGFPRK